jgi:hypothetical protein
VRNALAFLRTAITLLDLAYDILSRISHHPPPGGSGAGPAPPAEDPDRPGRQGNGSTEPAAAKTGEEEGSPSVSQTVPRVLTE